MNLRRVRVSREPLPPVATAFPPVPTRPREAEPYPPAPDPSPTTTAHAPRRFRGWLGATVRRSRDRLAAWRGEAIREAWAKGYRGGRLVERAETLAALRDRLRAELEAGHYDYRDGNGAARMILAYLAEESQ